MLTKTPLPRMQMRSRLAVLLLASAAIIAPVMVRVDAQHGLRLLPAMAHAKDGDRGGDDRGGDDRGGDDRGGRGGDDDRGGRRGRGRYDKPSGPVGGGYGGARPTEVERSTRGIEVTYSDGWREELENGRYELKDAQGRTVIERSATPQDRARLASFTR